MFKSLAFFLCAALVLADVVNAKPHFLPYSVPTLGSAYVSPYVTTYAAQPYYSTYPTYIATPYYASSYYVGTPYIYSAANYFRR